MICEDVPKTHINSYPARARKFVWVRSTKVEVVLTPCNFGGHRACFLCPDCRRRCAILYPTKCRICLGLHYRSEHKSPTARQLQKAIKHREKLGQKEGGIIQAIPSKPKRMRWRTYAKLREVARDNESRFFADLYTHRWLGKK